METEVRIKITAESRHKLKLLAVLTSKTMIELVEQLADEALRKHQDGNSQGVQVQNLSEQDTTG